MKTSNLHSMIRDEGGAVAILWAFTLPVAIGFIGLGADIGLWYSSKRDLQNLVDVAAVAAAYELSGKNPQSSVMYNTAVNELQRNGITSDDDVTITVHYPPISGDYIGDTQSVEVVAVQPQQRLFSTLFLADDPDATVRAVASRQPLGSACVLALSGAADSAVYFQGSSTISLNGCSVASNSTSSSAIDISGSTTLSTYSLYTAGDISQSGSPALTTTEGAITGASEILDPFADLSVPAYSGCDKTNFSPNSATTIDPGVYCNGINFKSKADVTMNPGVYIINGGDFNANAGAKITGDGVTIILTSSTGSDYATITINGGASVQLSAMTSGDTEGVLIYQDRDAPYATNQNKINGDSTTSYTGALYFPKQEVQFSGNSSVDGGSCTKIVADTITFTGNTYMSSTCPDSVATVNTQGLVSLVE